MKKAILLLQLALATGATHISAQSRSIDLETNLVSPAEDATIPLNQPFDLEFYFKNLGPDPILPGDTLAFQFSGMGNYAGIVIGTTKNVNDTIHFKTTLSVAQSPSNPFSFCTRGLIYSSVHTDSDPSNNEKCHIVYFTGGSTNVPDLVLSETTPVTAVEIYPNPATDIIRLNYQVKQQGNITLTITDVSGRKLMHTDLGKKNAGDNNMSTDVSALPSGMYFIEITESHSKGRGKLLIQR